MNDPGSEQGPPRRVRSIALLASGLVVTTALVRVPIELWRSSERDFGSPPAHLLLVVCGVGLLGFAGIALPTLAVPARLRRPADAALAAVAGYAWVRAGFFPGPSVNLDGRHVAPDLGTGPAGLLVPLAVAALVAGLTLRHRPLASVLLFVPLGGGLVLAGGSALAGWRSAPAVAAKAGTSVLEWSRQGNVALLILDTLQSDVFEAVLAARPELRRQLDGFRFYRCASSTAPTTYLSLPTILTGETYDPRRSAREFFAGAAGEGSLLRRLSAAGYQASYAFALRTCPPGISCISTHALSRTASEMAFQDAMQLLDLGLYRVLPDGLRRRVLARGRGPFGSAHGQDPHVARATAALAALQRLAEASFVSDSSPTAKVIHSVLTHPPTVLGADCSLGPRREDREGAVLQAECALRLIAKLFDRLRAGQAYDVSNLVIIGDHGYGFPSRRVRGTADPKFRRIAGLLNPVVLVKPAGARGPLTTSDAPVTLGDIPRALCGTSGCDPGLGLRALERIDPRRERTAVWYAWNNEYWNRAEIPGLVQYRIRGDIRDPKSWWRAAEPYSPGTTIDFRRGENAAAYLGVGWGRRQPTHTWIVDPEASLRLRAHLEPGRDYLLTLVAPLIGGALAGSRQAALEVNGAMLAALSCADPRRPPTTHRVRVPASVLARAPDTTITFRSPGTASDGQTFDPCLALQTLELRPAS